ncbi:hypothetical protein B0H13DRAFT_1862992 [Mycena leptocephala]|nr:hypothetical protein B0H13DRAFT_1862992 [Mycena leptocephala]
MSAGAQYPNINPQSLSIGVSCHDALTFVARHGCCCAWLDSMHVGDAAPVLSLCPCIIRADDGWMGSQMASPTLKVHSILPPLPLLLHHPLLPHHLRHALDLSPARLLRRRPPHVDAPVEGGCGKGDLLTRVYSTRHRLLAFFFPAPHRAFLALCAELDPRTLRDAVEASRRWCCRADLMWGEAPQRRRCDPVVFAAGPGSLIREAGNAVAFANLGKKGRGAGGMAFSAEMFVI